MVLQYLLAAACTVLFERIITIIIREGREWWRWRTYEPNVWVEFN